MGTLIVFGSWHCTVCHRLFAYPLGAIGRLCSVNWYAMFCALVGYVLCIGTLYFVHW